MFSPFFVQILLFLSLRMQVSVAIVVQVHLVFSLYSRYYGATLEESFLYHPVLHIFIQIYTGTSCYDFLLPVCTPALFYIFMFRYLSDHTNFMENLLGNKYLQKFPQAKINNLKVTKSSFDHFCCIYFYFIFPSITFMYHGKIFFVLCICDNQNILNFHII